MAPLILLTGMIICLYLLHYFGVTQCLHLGGCVPEDRPHCEDFSHESRTGEQDEEQGMGVFTWAPRGKAQMIWLEKGQEPGDIQHHPLSSAQGRKRGKGGFIHFVCKPLCSRCNAVQ